MIKEKFWQITIVLATALHFVQGGLMWLTNIEANVFSSLGMVTIFIAFIYRYFTVTEKDLKEQES